MALFGGFAGNEGAELVYQGKGGTGSAFKVEGFKPPKEESTVADDKSVYRDVNSKLTMLGNSMKSAWSVDYDELQTDYDKVVSQLKDYEATKNKAARRDKWYNVNTSIAELQRKIAQSNKQERQYNQYYRNVANDQMGYYNQTPLGDQPSAWQELEGFAGKKIDERGDAPKVTRNTTQSALEYVLKNVKYQPDVVETYNKDATGKWTRKQEQTIDPAALRQNIAYVYQGMPANLKNVLVNTPADPLTGKTKLDLFFEKNPEVRGYSQDAQAQLFADYVIDEVYPVAEANIKTVNKDAVSLYSPPRGGRSRGRGGFVYGFKSYGGYALSANAKFEMDKVDEAGNYKISIKAQESGNLKGDNPAQDWIISGKDYKRLTGSTDPSIQDNTEMIIRGKLTYVQVNEDEGLEPVVGVVYETQQSGGGAAIGIKPDGTFDLTNLGNSKVKQGQIVIVPYSENRASIRDFGAEPPELYTALKPEADKRYEEKKGKKPAAASGTKGTTDGKKTPRNKPK
jgi:hypothetical protein